MFSRFPRRLIWTIALACVAPVAAGPVPRAEAEFTATTIRPESLLALDAPLVGFLQETPLTSTEHAHPFFELKSEIVAVETDGSELNFHPTASSVNPSTRGPTFHANATVQGVSNREGYRWNLFSREGLPPPKIQAKGDCLSGTPPPSTELGRLPVFGATRPKITREISTTLQWQPCGHQLSVEVTGDFLISLWAWNATLTADGKQHELTSGSHPKRSLPPGTPDLSAVVEEAYEVFLFVTNGTLRIPNVTGPATFYTAPHGVLTASNLLFEGVEGKIKAGKQVQDLFGNSVKFNGATQTTVGGVAPGQPFSANLTGDAQGIVVDGQILRLAQTPLLGSPMAHVLFWALLAAAAAWVVHWAQRPNTYYVHLRENGTLLGALEPKTWRQQRGAGYWGLAKLALKRDQFRKAHAYARRAQRLFPESLEAPLMATFLHPAQRHFDRSLRLFTALYPQVPTASEKAVVACLIARAAIAMRNPDEALAWLQKAHADDTATFDAEATDPRFDPLLADPWFTAARRRGLTVSTRAAAAYS